MRSTGKQHKYRCVRLSDEVHLHCHHDSLQGFSRGVHVSTPCPKAVRCLYTTCHYHFALWCPWTSSWSPYTRNTMVLSSNPQGVVYRPDLFTDVNLVYMNARRESAPDWSGSQTRCVWWSSLLPTTRTTRLVCQTNRHVMTYNNANNVTSNCIDLGDVGTTVAERQTQKYGGRPMSRFEFANGLSL